MNTKFLYNFLILPAFLLLPLSTSAAPSVSGVSGIISHGQSVTILGSGFGTKAQANPAAFSDMENNSTAVRIGSASWTHAGYPVNLSITTANPRNSRSVYSAAHNLAVAGGELAGFELDDVRSNTFYIQYRFYLGSDFAWLDDSYGQRGNVKIFRLWDASDNNFVIVPLNHTPITTELCNTDQGGYGTGWQPVSPQYTCIDQAFGHACREDFWGIYPGAGQWTYAEDDLTKNSWHQFQFEYRDGNVQTSDGVFRWWVDGKLVFDRSDVMNKCTSNSKYPLIVGFFTAHSDTASGLFQIDDAYVDTTWQRIEIGNNANYNNCTLKEIQPATTWSDTSAALTVNQGSFADGATGYVFVTDANGVRNTGYQITFGSGSSDTTAPSAPSGLSVN